MKLFNRREVKGAISILLVVIMLPMMVLSAFMVDTARYNLSKSMVSSAGDLAINGALADYDTILKDVYGLFAISQSDEELEANVKKYFKESLVSYGVVEESEAEDYVSSLLGSIYEYFVVEDKEAADFMQMNVEDAWISVTLVNDSALSNPDVLEKQIVEYMKYRGPVEFGMSFLDSLSAFTKVDQQTDVILKQVEAQESMEEVADKGEKAYKAAKAYDDLYNSLQPDPLPTDGLYLTNYGRILQSYKERYREINRITILFCVTNYAAKWEIADGELRILNPEGDWIVGDAIVRHLSEAPELSYGSLEISAAMSAVETLKDAVVMHNITDYGTTRKFDHGYGEAYTSVLTDFQSTDRFYRDRYSDFSEACISLDKYARGVDAFAVLANGKIDEKNGVISSLEEEIESLKDKLEEYEAKAVLTAVETADKVLTESRITELEGDIDEARDAITELEGNRDSVVQVFQNILGACGPAVNAYNSDVRAYRAYIKTMETFVGEQALDMASQFNQIYNNLSELRDKLALLESALGEVKGAVDAYIGRVNGWEAQNSSYTAGTGTDNFSENNAAAIEEAKNTFDPEEIGELLTIISEQKGKISSCIAEIDAGDNFTYCGRPIAELFTAQNVRDAVFSCGNGDELVSYARLASPDIGDCESYFAYKGEIADAEHFLTDLKKMMEPYPCCKYMNYLYQTYKVDQEELEKASEAEQKEANDNKKIYEDLKSGSNKVDEKSESGTAGGYGYSYVGKTIGGTGYPSSSESSDKEVNSSKTENSSGLAENKKVVNNLLDGLSNAMEKGRDKLFVMEYLFDNFSYNTIVQDLARKGGEEPSWLHCGADVYSGYLGMATTSSHVPINGTNNQLYGAEIEYILFGNSNPEKNVASVKASIFAIRFLFNAVYAFTDSEVRNETRAIALAVQAASAGIIPYQLVQVVLQLALAMGESAVDLMNMNAGAQVVIVKSRDTWTMSAKGLVNLTTEAVKAKVKDELEDAVAAVNDKISEIVDASADKLQDAVDDIGDDLKSCVDSASREILDSMVMQIETAIDAEMSKVMYFSDAELGIDAGAAADTVKGIIKSEVGKAFDAAKSSVESVLVSAAGEGEISRLLADAVKGCIDGYIDGVKSDVLGKIDSFSTSEDVRKYVFGQLSKVKEEIRGKLTGQFDSIMGSVKTAFDGKITDLENEVKGKAAEATEAAKEEILERVNGFVDDISRKSTKLIDSALPEGSLADANKNAVSSSSKASIIKFGYSDYLRLFVFIGLCASDRSGAMLKRTADVIQLNISQAGDDSALHHASKTDFSMFNARTYVSVEADVELGMLFLNLGIFQRQVEEYNTELEEDEKIDLTNKLKIHYIGIGGY